MPFVYYDTETATTSTAGHVLWQTTTTSTSTMSSLTVMTWTIDGGGTAPRREPELDYQPVIDWRREQQARAVRHHSKAAKARAQSLLIAKLSQEQRKTYEEKKWFVVEGGQSGMRYRIREDVSLVANIDVLHEDGSVVRRLCAHCGLREVPLGDQLLMQKLMLETAEDDFLRIANRHAA